MLFEFAHISLKLYTKSGDQYYFTVQYNMWGHRTLWYSGDTKKDQFFQYNIEFRLLICTFMQISLNITYLTPSPFALISLDMLHPALHLNHIYFRCTRILTRSQSITLHRYTNILTCLYISLDQSHIYCTSKKNPTVIRICRTDRSIRVVLFPELIPNLLIIGPQKLAMVSAKNFRYDKRTSIDQFHAVISLFQLCT